MPYKYCQHVRENGLFCSSPAMKGRSYCYFHLRSRARRFNMAQARANQKPWYLELPPLEDIQAVQVSIQQVMDAVAAGAIDGHRAGLLLYALQQASINIRANTWMLPGRFAVRDDDELLADRYPSLEEEYDLPKGLDFSARPEKAFPPRGRNPLTPLIEVNRNWFNAMKEALEVRAESEAAALPAASEPSETPHPPVTIRPFVPGQRIPVTGATVQFVETKPEDISIEVRPPEPGAKKYKRRKNRFYK